MYWYDPLIADHFDIPIEEVISARVKMKPFFEDLIFDTFKEKTNATIALVNAGILTELQALKELGYDKYVTEKQELDRILEEQRQESIAMRQEQLRQQGNLLINQNEQQPSNNAKNLQRFSKNQTNQQANNENA